MKKLLFVVFLVMLVMGIGAQSTNRSWDKAFENGRCLKPIILYEKYVPDYSKYKNVTLEEAKASVLWNENPRFDGYYYTINLVVYSKEGNNNAIYLVSPELLQSIDSNLFKDKNRLINSGEKSIFKFYYNQNTLQALEELDIITVWYRGVSRKTGYNQGNGLFIDKVEITGKFIKEKTAYEIEQEIKQAKEETERQKPRFSPEGKEYVKKTLLQAVGEANNPANKGKTLFFESSYVNIDRSTIIGTWRVSERGISSSSNSFTLMEYYDKVPLAFYAICYRVVISNIGVARYVIDSFTEASSLYLQ